jgi:maleate isomerase
VTNSALAVIAAMKALQASRIALVSPYPAWLTEHSRAYWQSRELQVQQVVQLNTDAKAFHPIYALESQAASQGIAAVTHPDVQAVLLLGTGLPTLPALAQHPFTPTGKPVLSCNLVLIWHALELMRDPSQAPRAHVLMALLEQRRWRLNLTELQD